MQPREKLRLSISTQVFLGLVLGLLAGVRFGERLAPLQAVGKAFIVLLQMPVLRTIGAGGLECSSKGPRKEALCVGKR
jgi:Na+/H+-dicarboxylate symporter